MKKAVVIVSGGLDSVTLAYLLKSEGCDLHLIAFDYGQRHKRELEFARLAGKALNSRFDMVDISAAGRLLGGSALTDNSISVPHGHYAAPSMAITIVPNRNAIFLTIAYGAAVAGNAEIVATAVHGGDHFVYPDCRPQFLAAFDAMQKAAVEGCGHPDLRLHTPFADKFKHDIVAIGAKLGVPFSQTWSCYEGGETHCGQCGTCVERKESFALSGVSDPTIYQN